VCLRLFGVLPSEVRGAGLGIGAINVTLKRVGHGHARIILPLVFGGADAFIGAMSAEPGP
jgi:hypothetical protein